MKDKFIVAKNIRKNKPVEKVGFICNYCKEKKVLDLGCVRHSADYSLNDPNWLHRKIKEVADSVLGVDYLQDEVRKLRAKNYDIIYGDVTRDLDIDDSFDVIVAGDLIEHLTNFDCFFQNILRLLKSDGVLILTTPNPFYSDLFFYCIFKKNIIVNPEHTCFIDPITLNQLISRYNLEIEEIYYIKDSWKLRGVIFENEKCRYDILSGKWIINDKVNLNKGLSIDTISNSIFISLKRILKSNNKLCRYIFVPCIRLIKRLGGIFFNVYYLPFKWFFGLNSKFVKHSDYLVVIKKK